MNKYFQWLGGLLALQIVLALGLFWSEQSLENNHEQRQLISSESSDAIDKIVINTQEQSTILARTAKQWQLPNLDGLHVNDKQLKTMLEKLRDSTTHWPVTTTASSHTRFDVAKDKFQRRIQLFKGDQLLDELFLGSSPGFRKIHVRRSKEDDVYSVELSAHDFPGTDEQWINKSLIAASAIKSIKGNDFSLTRENEKWQLNNNTETIKNEAGNSHPNEEKIKQLAQALKSLQVSGVAKEPPQPSSNEIKTLDVVGASHWSYQFIKANEKYYVRRNDIDTLFTLSQYDYDRIAGITLEDLSAPIPETTQETSESSDTPPQAEKVNG